MSKKMKNQVRSLTNNPTYVENGTLNKAIDSYGQLNYLIDSGLKEIIKWCAKSTRDDTKERYVFSLKNLEYILEHLSTEVLVTINVTPLENEFGKPWCWMLTKIKKKRICF